MEFCKCIICDSKESFTEIEKVSDRFSPSVSYNIQQCSCGMVMLNPRPNEKQIEEHYRVDNYHPQNTSTGIFGFFYKFAQILNNFYKFKIINKYLNNGKALDYGGGDGNFQVFLTKKNWSVDVYEPFLKSRNDGSDTISNIDNIKINNYDLITMFHSIEHIHQIDKSLKKIYLALKKKSILMLAIPNYDAYERIYFRKKWVAYDAPRHLYHFNQNSLIRLLQKYNFKFIEKKPLYLDTFYNIIMSSNLNLISVLKSLLILIKSVFAIIRDDGKSSSLILIFKKI